MNDILNEISSRIKKIESQNRKSNVGKITAIADGVAVSTALATPCTTK